MRDLPPSARARRQDLRSAAEQAAGGGDDDIMREYITNGTPRMPSFKGYLKSTDIDAIISYVRTVPAPAPRQRRAERKILRVETLRVHDSASSKLCNEIPELELS